MIKPLAFLLTFCCFLSASSQDNKHNLIIGTYTNSCQSDGIYVYSFNSDTADFELKASTQNVVNPSFLTLSPDRKFIYSVNENRDNSQISAFSYDSASGKIVYLNSQSSEGNDPCHIINDENNVIAANYSGGNVIAFGKENDGSLGKRKYLLTFAGSSVNKARQEKPHLHQAVFSPDHKYILFADLGADFIYAFKYRPENPTQIFEPGKVIKTKQGSGPRHLTFSADGKFVYSLHELDGSVQVFKFNQGALSLIYSTTLIPNEKDEISAAEIMVSPDGNYLYTTNRGTFNTITCYKIKKNGRLEFVEAQSTLGKGPRNFTIDPTGNFLLVGHQYTNNIVVFRIDKASGKLTDTGKRLELCAPVCLLFE